MAGTSLFEYHTRVSVSPAGGGIESLRFEPNELGLVAVVAQDHVTGEIRMVAWASREAVLATLETGRATFFSRSRGELWEKGKTSGHGLAVVSVLVDCDADALVYLVAPSGPSCHTGAPSCFFRVLDPDGSGAAMRERVTATTGATVLARLDAVLEARRASTASASYARSLYDGGPPKIGAKLREEAAELAEAVASETDARVTSEAADVLFHVMVALRSRGIGVEAVLHELERRAGTSGHDEKQGRPPKPKPV